MKTKQPTQQPTQPVVAQPPSKPFMLKDSKTGHCLTYQLDATVNRVAAVFKASCGTDSIFDQLPAGLGDDSFYLRNLDSDLCLATMCMSKPCEKKCDDGKKCDAGRPGSVIHLWECPTPGKKAPHKDALLEVDDGAGNDTLVMKHKINSENCLSTKGSSLAYKTGCSSDENKFQRVLVNESAVTSTKSSEKCRRDCKCGMFRKGDAPRFEWKHSFYINLDRRPDRRKDIEKLLTAAKLNFTRISAWDGNNDTNQAALKGCWGKSPFKVCKGQVGCQMSHMTALKMAVKQDLPHVAIFEDDFMWLSSTDVAQVKQTVEDAISELAEWDGIALGLNFGKADRTKLCDAKRAKVGPKGSVELARLHTAQTTGGYILSKRAIRKLLDAFSVEKCEVKKDYHTAIDQCWKPYMRVSKWFAFSPQLGGQKSGTSDIEHRKVAYKFVKR